MAKRRMFSKQITETGKFYLLTPLAQLLYFHMGMMADDDGFVDCYTIMRSLDATSKELDELIDRGYVKLLTGEEYICFITAWFESNSIRNDRYNPSEYHDRLYEVSGGKAGEPPNNRTAKISVMH